MPESYVTDVRADQIVVDSDLILRGNGEAIHAVSRDSKTKWTILELVTGETMRVENASLISVERERETSAERAAKRLDAELHWLDRTERAAVAGLAKARERAAQDLLDGKSVTSWNLLDVVAAQALYALWETVRRASVYQCQRPEDEQLTRLEVLQAVRDEVQEKLLGYMQLTSRSTSQASNLVEDCEREVQLRWLRDTTGFGRG